MFGLRSIRKACCRGSGLAQALMHRPRLLILDEPTDGVDPVGRREIRDILNGLTGTGVTVFINSHLLSEVESFCDYVAILHRGKLALQGRMSALVAGKGYAITASRLPESCGDNPSSARSRGPEKRRLEVSNSAWRVSKRRTKPSMSFEAEAV